AIEALRMKPSRIEMITITTRSSTRVNPARRPADGRGAAGKGLGGPPCQATGRIDRLLSVMTTPPVGPGPESWPGLRNGGAAARSRGRTRRPPAGSEGRDRPPAPLGSIARPHRTERPPGYCNVPDLKLVRLSFSRWRMLASVSSVGPDPKYVLFTSNG